MVYSVIVASSSHCSASYLIMHWIGVVLCIRYRKEWAICTWLMWGFKLPWSPGESFTYRMWSQQCLLHPVLLLGAYAVLWRDPWTHEASYTEANSPAGLHKSEAQPIQSQHRTRYNTNNTNNAILTIQTVLQMITREHSRQIHRLYSKISTPGVALHAR